MIKKIVGWTLFAAVIGLMIYGAILRTNSKLADASPERQSEQAQNEGENRGQTGQGQNRSEAEEHESEPVESLTSSATNSDLAITTPTDSDLASFAGDSEHEWLTLTGTVAAVTTKVLTVTLDDGQTLLIERRPWRFALENDFTTTPGDQIQIIGFYENDLFQAAQLHDLTTDLIVRLRDETGHPLWASE